VLISQSNTPMTIKVMMREISGIGYPGFGSVF
jgi:hypothetical protein